MKYLKSYIVGLLVVLSVFSSCKKKSNDPFPVEPLAFNSLIVGYVDDNELGSKAMLWLNGERTDYLDNFISGRSRAVDIRVIGNDIYIAINDFSTNTSKIIKNEEILFETTPEIGASFNKIFVKDGNFYVCGLSVSDNVAKASIWENGVLTQLDTLLSNALSIWVDQDVYACGLVNDGIVSRASYWKNGQRVLLNQSDYRSNARDLKVFNNQVHVIGEAYNTTSLGLYWVDGVEYDLTDSLSFNDLQNLLIADNKLYILGEDPVNDQIKLYDGNSFTILSGTDIDAQAMQMKIVDQDIYTFGFSEALNNPDSSFARIYKESELIFSQPYESDMLAFDVFVGELNL